MYYLSYGIPKTNQRNSKNWLAESCNAELKLHCLNSDVRNSWVFIVQLWTTSDAGALMNICMSFETLSCNISYWNMIIYWWRESHQFVEASNFSFFFPNFVITNTWAWEKYQYFETASLMVNLLWSFLSYFCHYIYMSWRNFSNWDLIFVMNYLFLSLQPLRGGPDQNHIDDGYHKQRRDHRIRSVTSEQERDSCFLWLRNALHCYNVVVLVSRTLLTIILS